MNRYHVLIGVGLVVISALGGAAIAGGDDSATGENNAESGKNARTVVYEDIEINGGVKRFTDEEAGVTCYIFARSGGYDGEGGISCIPTNQTELPSG